jgi:hypothetical protein
MSDTTTDTSAIDNKQNTSSTTATTNIPKFFITLITSILFIIIYFSLGGVTLYACKLAQSNILPTEKNCFPYTYYNPKIDEIQTNIFTTFTDPPLSMKMKFPFNEFNSTNKIIDLFRNYKNEPNSSFLMNYFIQIIESLILFNYSSLNWILNGLNNLPEIIIVLFGPSILFFLAFLVFLWDHLYVIYLWFVSMSWFFKTNTNENPIGKPIWETVSFLEPVNFACAIGLVILFSCLVWLLIIGLPVLPFITLIICVMTIPMYKAEMNGHTITVINIVKDLFKYYKTTIMSIFSLLVVISAFTNLGTIPGVISLAILLCIYFGIVSVDLFNPKIEPNLSGIVSNKQAKKVCHLNEPLRKKHGMLYYLFSGGASDLKKDLIKLAKQMD